MASLATADYYTPNSKHNVVLSLTPSSTPISTPISTTDYDNTPYASEDDIKEDSDYELEEGILAKDRKKQMKQIRLAKESGNNLYKDYPETLKQREKLLESNNCYYYEFYEKDKENKDKAVYNLFNNCYLTAVDYLPDERITKKTIQSLNKLKKVGSKRIRTYKTLPIYLINAHSAIEPRLFLRPPKELSKEQYLKDTEFVEIDLLTQDGYTLDYAPYKHTKKFAARKDFFKTKPTSNKFIITTTPMGYDSSCGDNKQVDFLKEAVLNPSRLRDALQSEHFDSIFSMNKKSNNDDDDQMFQTNLYFSPGYSVLNKSYQFWDSDKKGRLYDKWGVIRLDKLKLDDIIPENKGGGGAFDFFSPPIHLDPDEKLNDEQLAEKRKKLINPYCEPKIRKLINKSIEEEDDISLKKITDTLGAGMYLDFSCSGMVLKIYDPSNNRFNSVDIDKHDETYSQIYSAVQESYETISRYNKLSWNNIFSRKDYVDDPMKYENLKRDGKFSVLGTELQNASKKARLYTESNMEGGKKQTKKDKHIGKVEYIWMNKNKKKQGKHVIRWIVDIKNGRYIGRAPKAGVYLRDLYKKRDKDASKKARLYTESNMEGGRRKTKRKLLPKLRKLTKKNKKHIYKLKDPHKKRILAIDEGINYEHRVKRKTKKKAAIAKKGRFNILRIYRRNQTNGDCQKLTRDMRYMDKKYNLGKTKSICKQKAGKRKTRKNKKTKQKAFLYNPNDPKKSFDVYIDKDPSDTIPIKYSTVKDVRDTIKKLEILYKTKKYTHKRIWQVGMIMKVRLEAMLKHKKSLYPHAKNVKERYILANKYFKFLGKRTKYKDFNSRKALTFKF